MMYTYVLHFFWEVDRLLARTSAFLLSIFLKKVYHDVYGSGTRRLGWVRAGIMKDLQQKQSMQESMTERRENRGHLCPRQPIV